MEIIRSVTKHVAGIDVKHGGSGDPSPLTALGVRRGIEACVKVRLGRDTLEGLHVAVQGIGHDGYHLCKELHSAGAKLTVADVDPLKAERAQREFGAVISKLDALFDVDCEVLAPCALGSALNDETVPRLRTRIVAGAANNQLAEPRHGDALFQRGILYAPDYAINAGGLINVAEEVKGYDPKRARERVMKIYDTIFEVAERSQMALLPTYRVADTMVEERLAKKGARMSHPV
jgi:leucine dehydrogenase